VAELVPGAHALDGPLRDLDGESTSVGFVRGAAPVAFLFFKVDCPTCPIALSAFDRLHEAYSGAAVRVVAISQDGAEKTRSFVGSSTVPTLLDDADWAVSRAYGLETVPTLVLIDGQGRVERVEEGWSRQAYNEVSRRLSEISSRPFVAASEDGDGKPPWKPG
jgi:peroxiredoxin